MKWDALSVPADFPAGSRGISTSASKARICISGCERSGNLKVQATYNYSFPGLNTGNRIRWYGQFYRDGRKTSRQSKLLEMRKLVLVIFKVPNRFTALITLHVAKCTKQRLR